MPNNKLISVIRAYLLKEEQNLGAYALLLIIGFSTLGITLFFVPADGDDLILLSSVANKTSPVNYFFGDWGLGNNVYRPLHSLTLWLSYQFFGVSAGFNQLFNLVLHIAIIFLLFRFIRRIQPDITISFLFASLSLISIYTISSVSWVSDRPTLFVALFFLLLLNHLYSAPDGHPKSGRISYIVILSVLALMGKESGLILPLFAVFHAVYTKQAANYRKKIVSIAVIILVAYISFRLVIFGPNAYQYFETGYLLGFFQIDDLSTLPKLLQYFYYFESIIKNILAPFFPVFNWEGGILIRELLIKSPMWMLTALLVFLTARREPSAFQKVALVIIILNSVIHFSVFRLRTQYISQLALSIFFASSPLLKSKVNRKILVKALSASLLIYSVFWASRSLDQVLLSKYEALNIHNLTPVTEQYPNRIDDHIIDLVLQRYKR